LQSLAALRFAAGDHDDAERIQRQAIALNPNNPEALAQLGYRLALRGRWDEGRRFLEDAISRSVVVPSWYYTTLAMALYLGGDLAKARDAADAGKSFAAGYGQATLAFTEAALGNAKAARAALDEALRQSPLLARDPVAFWANFQIAPSVIERFNAGLAKAGLQLPAAIAPATAPRS
jgi:tetratricopeptide (TPR) repeat protein